MDFRQLEYFLAIVDQGGFQRAAATLYVSQPTLSQSVQSLERDLGSSLFHRIGRRAVLTQAGTAFMEPARAAVRGLELARASVGTVHELRGGALDIASMPSQAVEPLTGLIQRFSARRTRPAGPPRPTRRARPALPALPTRPTLPTRPFRRPITDTYQGHRQSVLDAAAVGLLQSGP